MKAKNETDNNNTNEMNEIPLNIQRSFSEVYDIILTHRQRVASVVDNESLLMVWHVGQYVSGKLKTSEWGDGIVRQLSEYIRQQDPTTRGWSYRTIYKMVQFFDTYSRSEFLSIVEQNNVMGFAESKRIAPSVVVPVETAQLQNAEIVPFKTAQMPQVLYATGWTNHQLILNRCKTNAERLFYILYAGRERLKNKELERAIKTNVMTSLLDCGKIQTDVLKDIYPQSQVLFKDTAYLDFLGLPQKYKEKVYQELTYLSYAPIIFISAKTGQRVNKLFELINQVANQNALRVSTAVLNQVLNEAIAIVQPPTDKGKRLKIYYMTQASTKPPTFVVFVNDKELFHFSYERYLVNQLRKEFTLTGTPVRIIVREKKDKDKDI